MDLIVNGTALRRTSLGGRRYCHGVLEALAWATPIEVTRPPRWSKFERVDELLLRGRTNAIFWSPCQRGPLFARNHVVTVLDCINVEYIYRHDLRLPLYRALFNSILDHATAVVAISKTTRDAILRNYQIDSGKLHVIGGPVNFGDNRGHRRSVACAPDNEPPFVLMVTNALPHKNTARACDAFAASSAVGQGIALRVVGSVDAEAVVACRAAGVRLELHSGVDDETLVNWISRCRFLFSPSLDEGLNLPIAEALSAHANVLCSDIPVHREFYDGEVRFFDPIDRDSIVDAINRAIDIPGAWELAGPRCSKRSFVDVARDYRSIFMGIATEARAS
jgi:glycosyltransferase involved in cell wall biosynthesis